MIRTITNVLVSLVILIIPATAWSKGATVKIEIEGNNLASPIEITDPNMVGQFNIWNGPGVGTRNANFVCAW